MVPTRHTHDLFLVDAKARRGESLCGKMGYGAKKSLFLKQSFHDLGINAYLDKIRDNYYFSGNPPYVTLPHFSVTCVHKEGRN